MYKRHLRCIADDTHSTSFFSGISPLLIFPQYYPEENRLVATCAWCVTMKTEHSCSCQSEGMASESQALYLDLKLWSRELHSVVIVTTHWVHKELEWVEICYRKALWDPQCPVHIRSPFLLTAKWRPIHTQLSFPPAVQNRLTQHQEHFRPFTNPFPLIRTRDFSWTQLMTSFLFSSQRSCHCKHGGPLHSSFEGL